MGNKFTKDDYESLRKRFDGDEQFVDGSQVITPRRPDRSCPAPEWAMSEKGIHEFLLQAYRRMLEPCGKSGKFGRACISHEVIEDEYERAATGEGYRSFFIRKPCTRCRQLRQAMIWKNVIYSYFRMGETDTTIEENLRVLYGPEVKPGYVGGIIRSIRRTDAGQRRDGRPRSTGKRGRKPAVRSTTETIDSESLVMEMK